MSKNGQEKNQKYGALSIVILTISIVIGSGIFFKNEELMATNHSTLITMIAWFIVSGFVLTILYSYIEISSSTKITGEIGSLSTWGAKFFNNKVGRVIGYFFIFINLPINISLLSIYSSDLIFGMIDTAAKFTTLMNNWWYVGLRTLLTTLFALGILSSIGILNSISNNRAKDIQNFGFVVKLIPIITIIVILFVAFASTSFQSEFDNFGHVFDVSSSKNAGLYLDKVTLSEKHLKSVSSLITVLVISMPPVMFAFDGFIYSANLQSETKTKKSFSIGIVAALGIIVSLYLISSYAIMSLSNSDYTLFEVIENAFSPWVGTLFNVMLILSIVSGMSGLFSASIRATSSLSTDNLVKDEEFKLLRKNKNGVASKAGKTFLLISLLWVVLLRIFDSLSIVNQMFIFEGIAEIGFINMSGFAGNLGSSFAYLFYVFIIFGGILNRRRKTVETEELPLFRTISWISIIGITFISTFSILSIFVDLANGDVASYLNLFFTIIFFSIIPIIYWINDKKLRHLDKNFIVKKQVEIDKYYN